MKGKPPNFLSSSFLVCFMRTSILKNVTIIFEIRNRISIVRITMYTMAQLSKISKELLFQSKAIYSTYCNISTFCTHYSYVFYFLYSIFLFSIFHFQLIGNVSFWFSTQFFFLLSFSSVCVKNSPVSAPRFSNQ